LLLLFFQHVSTLVRQLFFDIVFVAENVTLLAIALSSNIKVWHGLDRAAWRRVRTRVARFFLVLTYVPKRVKYTKWSPTIPKGCKLYQMALKYSKWS
jgi:hypothetical protein